MTTIFKPALFWRTTTWLAMVLMLSVILPAQAIGASQPLAEAKIPRLLLLTSSE